MENDLVIPQYISKSSRFPFQAGENTTVSLVEVNQPHIDLSDLLYLQEKIIHKIIHKSKPTQIFNDPFSLNDIII